MNESPPDLQANPLSEATQCLAFHAALGFFPKQVYLWGSILEKKWLDTLVGARGFGSAGRAGLYLAVLGVLGWVGRGIWLWWARLGALGWVGQGCCECILI